MQKKALYRYKRADGGTTVSPVAPNAGTEYTVAYRLIADENMGLTKDGVVYVQCVDTDDPELWREETYDFNSPDEDQRIANLQAENASLAQQVEMLETGVTEDV